LPAAPVRKLLPSLSASPHALTAIASVRQQARFVTVALQMPWFSLADSRFGSGTNEYITLSQPKKNRIKRISGSSEMSLFNDADKCRLLFLNACGAATIVRNVSSAGDRRDRRIIKV
jgi:hypothetical protein